MGNNNNVPGTAMMNYSQNYTNVLNLIKFVSVLAEEESNGLVRRESERHPDLRADIIRCFADPYFSWMDIFNHDETRDFFDFGTEEEAREFATEMLLKPATS
jgi:hypothetical protein